MGPHQKKLGKDVAVFAARKLLQTGIEILSVERRDIEAAFAHVERGMDPRDAIHAAVAVRRGCSGFVSSDAAFSTVPKLKHIPLK